MSSFDKFKQFVVHCIAQQGTSSGFGGLMVAPLHCIGGTGFGGATGLSDGGTIDDTGIGGTILLVMMAPLVARGG